MDQRDDEARSARAQARRALSNGISGQVIRAGDAKPSLYADLSLEARVEHMAALCASQWRFSGGSLHRTPRHEWPGEIFECHRG